jgi:TRAP-type uncharacterized transport system substrate-binding protein
LKNALALLLFAVAAAASLQGPPRAQAEPLTIGMLASGPSELQIAAGLARSLDHENSIRILPIVGKGPVQSLTDLLDIRGVDVALLPADTLDFVKRNGLMKEGDTKVAQLVKLYPLDIHVLVRGDIKSLEDLASRTVATGSVASDDYAASRLLLSDLAPQPRIMELDTDDAVQAVIDGKADAAVLVGRRPLAELKSIKPESGLHLLSFSAPGDLAEVYSPALLTARDYPNLVAADTPVETVSTSLVMAVFDWKSSTAQYTKLRRLTEALFASIDEGTADAPDATGLNLAASVPGWRRHGAAEEVLAARAEETSEPTQ